MIGILPGRFQPPHKGHLQAYGVVKQVVGPNNAYIATSAKTDNQKSPLNFQEKQQIWTKHGVPIDKIVKVVNPYKSEEITHKFDPKTTTAIFFLSEKDAQRIPYTKKDGSPSYFQPYKGNENNLKPIEQNSYIYVVPTFSVNGKNISGTIIRQGLGSAKYTEEQKKKFFQWVFGWFDIALFDLLSRKFTESETNQSSDIKESREKLKTFMREIITEFVFSKPDGEEDIPPADSTDKEKGTETDPKMDRERKELTKQKLEAAKKKREFQLKQKKYREMGAKQDRRDIDDTDDEIDTLRSEI